MVVFLVGLYVLLSLSPFILLAVAEVYSRHDREDEKR